MKHKLYLMFVIMVFLLVGCIPSEQDLSQLSEIELLDKYEKLCDDQKEFAKDSCFINLLRFTGDPKFCEKDFFVPSIKQHCLNLYESYLEGEWPSPTENTYVQLFKTQNLTISKCMGFSQNRKESCFTNVAAGLKDITICSEIKSEEENEKCKAIIAELTADSTICETLSTYKNKCYTQVAITKEDKTLCKNIKDNNFMEISCYLEIMNKAS